MSKCDLHIHSRFSARSEEWLFRRFDFPDSYSDPRELLRQLVERGMDFVTTVACVVVGDGHEIHSALPELSMLLALGVIAIWIIKQPHMPFIGTRTLD